jgi:hypothetical protein
MKTVLQILALIGLALVCGAIVFVVNAPKWFDGKPPTTRSASR